MQDSEIKKIADDANLIVAGYAYNRRKEKDYRYFVTPKGFQLLADHHKLMIRYTNEYEGEK